MIFDDFLSAGLIPIGGEDDKYEKLIESSKQLGIVLKNEKAKVVNYTLVAIDSNITDKEPVLSEVEKIVAEQWKLVRSQFTEMPVSIYRAVILQALEDLGNESPKFAAIIWHSGSGMFPLFKKIKKESEILQGFLESMGDIAEKESVKAWSLVAEDPKVKISPLKMDKFSFGKANIDSDVLKSYLRIAAGITPENHNPYNHPEEWSTHFSENATKGISEAFNNTLESFNKSLTPAVIEDPINKFFTQFKKSLDQSLKTTFSSLKAIDRHNKLLWWKEALYSEMMRKSYRDLNEMERSIAMAYDLYNQLPMYCPASVSYILKETYNSIPTKKKKIKVIDFFSEIISKENSTFIEKFIKKSEVGGRTDFAGYLNNVFANKQDIDKLLFKFGIEPEKELSYDNISVLILNSLIANYLTE